jgi:hypothetical protein
MRCYALCSDAVGGPGDPAAEHAKLRATYAASAANFLEQAIANGSRNAVDIETDPDIDAIQNHPAVQRALDKLRKSAAAGDDRHAAGEPPPTNLLGWATSVGSFA